MLRHAHWLDPREQVEVPIRDSVNIPVSQLAERVFELPSKRSTAQIADVGPEAQQALEWLERNDRKGEIGTGFSYGAPGTGRLWSPNAFLEEIFPDIDCVTALDIACGSGRDAVFMASEGLRVTAVDHLPDALHLGRQLEFRYLDVAPRIDWICEDVDSLATDRQFDLVVCFFYLNRSFLSKLGTYLTPGGQFVMETFTTVHRERYGKPRTEQFVLQPGELKELLPSFSIRRYDEGWHADRHTARFWGRREV